MISCKNTSHQTDKLSPPVSFISPALCLIIIFYSCFAHFCNLAQLLFSRLNIFFPPGKILLLLSQSAHHTIFAVADDGPSIPKEEKAHIFERFYRTDHAHTDHNHFGLGLCTAQEIVRAHHGKILVHDPCDCSLLPEGFPQDRGVVFTVVLHG